MHDLSIKSRKRKWILLVNHISNNKYVFINWAACFVKAFSQFSQFPFSSFPNDIDFKELICSILNEGKGKESL